MADHNDGQDSCNLEISVCPEAHLEATQQDLETLAQEIAEAAVDDERRSSHTPSPTPQRRRSVESPSEEKAEDKDGTNRDDDDDGGHSANAEGEEGEAKRPQSPVDEASWVLLDAEGGNDGSQPEGEGGRRSPERRFSVFRKFLARGDLRQRLDDMGLTRDACNGGEEPPEGGVTLKDLVVSCSESMVICDMPQEEEQREVDGEDLPWQLFLKDPPDCPELSGWRGTFSGAKVAVEVERQGGLLVAGVKVWHVDLLSALVSLQNLVTSTGLVSYADVDVPSLLARAA